MRNKKSQNNSTTEDRDEARLQAVLTSAYAAPPTSDALRQRLTALVEAHPARQAVKIRRLRQLRLAGATLTATGAVALGVTGSIQMRQAAAGGAMLRQVDTAVSQVKSAHIVEWQPQGNGSRKYRETWYGDGAWRTEQPGLTVLLRDRMRYEHFEGDTKVRVSHLTKNPIPLTMAQMLQQYGMSGMRRYVRRLPDAIVAGRPARRLLLELPDCPPYQGPANHSSFAPQRAIVAVDPATDLPFQTETQTYRWWRWETVLMSNARYNEEILQERFATDFPGKQILMPEAAEAEAKQRQRKWMAETQAKATVTNRTVTLRNIDGTELGDAFMFYTVSGPPLKAGEPLPWTVELRDQSNRYWKPLGSGVVGDLLPHLAKRWTFNGERLHIAWFQPNRRGSMDEGGQWQATFRFAEGSAVLAPKTWNLGGGPITDNELYDEFVLKYGEQFARVCESRAYWLRSGGWLADSGLLRAAFDSGYDPRVDADNWDKEAAELRGKMARLTGQPVTP